jgi:HSP20 family protein
MAESQTLAQKDRAEQTSPERTRDGVVFTPRVDIVETEKELMLYADVPGVSPEDVDLHYENGELILNARVKRRSHTGNLLLAEYEEGDFYRAFNISESIDSSKIEASCKNGVLTVHLPKIEAVQPRQINVRAE